MTAVHSAMEVEVDVGVVDDGVLDDGVGVTAYQACVSTVSALASAARYMPGLESSRAPLSVITTSATPA